MGEHVRHGRHQDRLDPSPGQGDGLPGAEEVHGIPYMLLLPHQSPHGLEVRFEAAPTSLG